MGWRAIVSGLVLAACSYQPVCEEYFGFTTSLSGGARGCVATFSSDAASVSVSIGDMDAGCSATTNGEQYVSCASDEVPDAFTCWRVCSSSPPDALLIRAVSGQQGRIRAALGDPPIEQPISATIVCNGNVVSSETKKLLESCPL